MGKLDNLLLDDLTPEQYKRLWNELRSKPEMAERLMVSETTLYNWEKRNGMQRYVKDQKDAEKARVLEKRIRMNNDFRKQGLRPTDFFKELGFGSVNSYRSWKFKTIENGVDLW